MHVSSKVFSLCQNTAGLLDTAQKQLTPTNRRRNAEKLVSNDWLVSLSVTALVTAWICKTSVEQNCTKKYLK